MSAARAVVLVGPPGAGKTTVGQLLAAALGVAFRDTDADIEAAAGKPIPEIFIDEGEEHFRALERAAWPRRCAGFDGVLALGGGAVLAEATRALLAGGPWSSWRWASPTRSSASGSAPRPLLSSTRGSSGRL